MAVTTSQTSTIFYKQLCITYVDKNKYFVDDIIVSSETLSQIPISMTKLITIRDDYLLYLAYLRKKIFYQIIEKFTLMTVDIEKKIIKYFDKGYFYSEHKDNRIIWSDQTINAYGEIIKLIYCSSYCGLSTVCYNINISNMSTINHADIICEFLLSFKNLKIARWSNWFDCISNINSTKKQNLLMQAILMSDTINNYYCHINEFDMKDVGIGIGVDDNTLASNLYELVCVNNMLLDNLSYYQISLLIPKHINHVKKCCYCGNHKGIKDYRDKLLELLNVVKISSYDSITIIKFIAVLAQYEINDDNLYKIMFDFFCQNIGINLDDFDMDIITKFYKNIISRDDQNIKYIPPHFIDYFLYDDELAFYIPKYLKRDKIIKNLEMCHKSEDIINVTILLKYIGVIAKYDIGNAVDINASIKRFYNVAYKYGKIYNYSYDNYASGNYYENIKILLRGPTILAKKIFNHIDYYSTILDCESIELILNAPRSNYLRSHCIRNNIYLNKLVTKGYDNYLLPYDIVFCIDYTAGDIDTTIVIRIIHSMTKNNSTSKIKFGDIISILYYIRSGMTGASVIKIDRIISNFPDETSKEILLHLPKNFFTNDEIIRAIKSQSWYLYIDIYLARIDDYIFTHTKTLPHIINIMPSILKIFAKNGSLKKEYIDEKFYTLSMCIKLSKYNDNYKYFFPPNISASCRQNIHNTKSAKM